MEIPKKAVPYILILPAFLVIGFILLYPLILGFFYSFTNAELGGGPGLDYEIIGLRNYQDLMKDKILFKAIINTLIYGGGCVFFNVLIGLGGALILNEQIRFQKQFRTLALLPWLVPSVVVAILWRWFWNPSFGIIPYAFYAVGLTDTFYPFLSQTLTALPAVIITNVWRTYPVILLVILAGLQTLPHEHIEAAVIDGAGKIGRFRHLTMPHLSQYIGIAMLLQFMWNFQFPIIIWIMTRGFPSWSTTTLGIYAFRTAYEFGQFSYQSAIGVIWFILLMIIALIYLQIVKRQY